MASGATIYHLLVTLSDVDRSVFESLDLRIARHPSESGRYMLSRILAYCLCYEPGIAFSKGGLSSTDEAPITVRDDSGVLKHWIEIGSPSADRLHKAAKAASQVTLFTHTELPLLRREAASRAIHRVETIVVQRFDPAFLDQIESGLERKANLEVVRNAGQLYVTTRGATLESALVTADLVEHNS
jgi:uncharacterized protein YaeQ